RSKRDWSSDVCSSDLVGIFLVVYEKLVRVFVAGIIALALNRLGALANETIVPVAVPELPDRDVLDVIAFGNDGTPRLENQRVERSEERRVGKEGGARV